MDERRSLAILGWTVAGVVGLMFALNAIALALIQPVPTAHAYQPVSSQSGQPLGTAGQRLASG
jgi:hypothetical protein